MLACINSQNFCILVKDINRTEAKAPESGSRACSRAARTAVTASSPGSATAATDTSLPRKLVNSGSYSIH